MAINCWIGSIWGAYCQTNPVGSRENPQPESPIYICIYIYVYIYVYIYTYSKCNIIHFPRNRPRDTSENWPCYDRTTAACSIQVAGNWNLFPGISPWPSQQPVSYENVGDPWTMNIWSHESWVHVCIYIYIFIYLFMYLFIYLFMCIHTNR